METRTLEDLLQENEELRQRLEDAESTSAAALRKADRRQNEFLAILAHELRNSLAPLRNGIHLLGQVESPEPLARKTYEMMARQVENLVRLVDDLVEVGCGGTLSARSDGLGPGEETRPAEEGLSSGARKPGKPHPHARRILIVDDNRDAADSLGLLLRLDGHEVREANNGPKAIVVASEFHPDLIFLDIGMPGMDGYQVATRLRANPDLDDVRVIALSGYGTDLDRARSRAAGFDDHLVKPAEIGLVESILASLPATHDARVH